MKRLAPLILAIVLLLATSSAALAWDSATGCVVDGNNDPWTLGGTVVCRQKTTNIVVGQGNIGVDGCYSVYIGNGLQVNCTIDPAAGPGGDPEPFTCVVPTDTSYTPLPYDCGVGDTGTGPTAVSLSTLGAQALPASSALLVLSLLTGGAVIFRRRRA